MVNRINVGISSIGNYAVIGNSAFYQILIYSNRTD